MNSLAETINQRVEHYSLDELKQTAESVIQLASKFLFLSDGIKGKMQFYTQKLDSCTHEEDLHDLFQELFEDFNDPQENSLGQLVSQMTKSWGAKLVLKQCGLKRGNDPMKFIRDKLYANFNL